MAASCLENNAFKQLSASESPNLWELIKVIREVENTLEAIDEEDSNYRHGRDDLEPKVKEITEDKVFEEWQRAFNIIHPDDYSLDKLVLSLAKTSPEPEVNSIDDYEQVVSILLKVDEARSKSDRDYKPDSDDMTEDQDSLDLDESSDKSNAMTDFGSLEVKRPNFVDDKVGKIDANEPEDEKLEEFGKVRKIGFSLKRTEDRLNSNSIPFGILRERQETFAIFPSELTAILNTLQLTTLVSRAAASVLIYPNGT